MGVTRLRDVGRQVIAGDQWDAGGKQRGAKEMLL